MADVFTPVGIYLRLRDRFRDTILLESSDHNSAENSYSFIGINAIAGIEISNLNEIDIKYPNEDSQKISIEKSTKITDELYNFMQVFHVKESVPMPMSIAQGLFGYMSYDALQLFENIDLNSKDKENENEPSAFPNDRLSLNLFSENSNTIPLVRYRLYQYVIAINHFKSELYICENKFEGIEGDTDLIESIIRSKDIPAYPFANDGAEISPIDNNEFKKMLKVGIDFCNENELSHLFLSRAYNQKFIGDEFNVYRALRNINPGPHLFYFDYGDYRLIGSGNGISFKNCGEINGENANPFHKTTFSFPAEKFCGLPKHKAIELIDQLEKDKRGFYGGSAGFVGFDGSINHAVMIHAFLSKNSELKYRAGIDLNNNSGIDEVFSHAINESASLEEAIKMAVEHSNE